MKKSLLILGLAIAMISCNKPAEKTAEVKTAYIDTAKLLDEYTEAKDLEAKYKSKSEVMGKDLDAQVKHFQAEAADFQKNAQARGAAWAQQKGQELQKREQELQYMQQSLMQTLQKESGSEMDTLVKSVKKFIKEYGKEKGYSYIYGTGESANILYAKEEYDITGEIVKALNDKYKKGGATTEATPAVKTEEKK
ncbi:OmpH family outer membrane protein [Flavobacterium sp. '19STA2R22 D10 B1']|uniref:OmpH family outer membrane protein n=1 Tax=Flavobacterium aerium TaxID=3037261 RepID=UPI00278C658F|nr:OmpH family outer membrane protein [Flavobacterium sp. '19STA2R22 D10 B1']